MVPFDSDNDVDVNEAEVVVQYCKSKIDLERAPPLNSTRRCRPRAPSENPSQRQSSRRWRAVSGAGTGAKTNV